MLHENQCEKIYKIIKEKNKHLFEKEYLEHTEYKELQKNILTGILEKLFYAGAEVNLAYEVFYEIKYNPNIYKFIMKKKKILSANYLNCFHLPLI